jgi:nitrogen fixation-related uncharacterized protein
MLLIIVAIVAAFALIGIAAQRWGVDSRPSFGDPRVVDSWSHHS